MKTKIVQDKIWGGYWWVILYSNGAVAAESPEYTRKDNAKRGLERFLANLKSDFICGVGVYEKFI